MAAPVTWGASTPDEVVGFEVVQEADQNGALDSQCFGESDWLCSQRPGVSVRATGGLAR
jgi:hypothetical protein